MPTEGTYEALSSFGNQHAKLVNGILARKYRKYNATLGQYKTANGQTEHVKNFFGVTCEVRSTKPEIHVIISFPCDLKYIGSLEWRWKVHHTISYTFCFTCMYYQYSRVVNEMVEAIGKG